MAELKHVLDVPWCGVGSLTPIAFIRVSYERESQHKPLLRIQKALTNSSDQHPIKQVEFLNIR